MYTGDILEALVLTAGVITVPVCTMTRRSSVEKYGIRFDENLVIGPDWDFWIQLARHAQFGYLDRLTCMYRVHLTNITRISGLRKRKDDLVYGRLKVLNSDWFGELSVHTRLQFFHQLLIGLLADQPVQQKAILESDRFRGLPDREQANLWRRVGVGYLLKESERDFAVRCLQDAVSVCPEDRRSRYLQWLLKSGMGRSAVPKILRLWRIMHRSAGCLRHRDQRQRRSVLAGLRPIGD